MGTELKTIIFNAEDSGAEDGVRVRKFKKGDIEILPAWFADKFIENGTATEYEEGETETHKPSKGSKSKKKDED